MKRRRVRVLTHADLVPPADAAGLTDQEALPFQKELDVLAGLRRLGHDVQILGLSDELAPLRQHVEGFAPHIVFNLLMEFQDVAVYQAHVTSYLELLRVPYAGCNPRGLLLARDKALAKRIFRSHRIPTPGFQVHPLGRRPRPRAGLGFPQFVKSVDEEASLGIAKASLVHDTESLVDRIEFVHRHLGTDAIAEEYIEGRELTVGVLGNDRLHALPVWELFFDNLPPGEPRIATARVKWDLAYQKRLGVSNGPARELPAETGRELGRLAKRIYRGLGLSGYARIDLRMRPDGRVYALEANPNPDLTDDEDFAMSAAAAGLPYPALLQRILNLGLRYVSPWKRGGSR